MMNNELKQKLSDISLEYYDISGDCRETTMLELYDYAESDSRFNHKFDWNDDKFLARISELFYEEYNIDYYLLPDSLFEIILKSLITT